MTPSVNIHKRVPHAKYPQTPRCTCKTVNEMTFRNHVPPPLGIAKGHIVRKDLPALVAHFAESIAAPVVDANLRFEYSVPMLE